MYRLFIGRSAPSVPVKPLAWLSGHSDIRASGLDGEELALGLLPVRAHSPGPAPVGQNGFSTV